jgi:hypothetical protein
MDNILIIHSNGQEEQYRVQTKVSIPFLFCTTEQLNMWNRNIALCLNGRDTSSASLNQRILLWLFVCDLGMSEEAIANATQNVLRWDKCEQSKICQEIEYCALYRKKYLQAEEDRIRTMRHSPVYSYKRKHLDVQYDAVKEQLKIYEYMERVFYEEKNTEPPVGSTMTASLEGFINSFECIMQSISNEGIESDGDEWSNESDGYSQSSGESCGENDEEIDHSRYGKRYGYPVLKSTPPY